MNNRLASDTQHSPTHTHTHKHTQALVMQLVGALAEVLMEEKTDEVVFRSLVALECLLTKKVGVWNHAGNLLCFFFC